MKKLLFGLGLLIMTSCHQDKDSYLTVTVLDANENRMEGITVDMKPANGGDADWLLEIDEPRNGQIHVHQDSQQYWGQDFKETITLK
jgi:hypothetical protein